MLLKKMKNGKIETAHIKEKQETENSNEVPSTSKKTRPISKPQKKAIAKKFAFSPISQLRQTSCVDHKLNGYSKGVILSRLESGCSKQHFPDALKSLKVPKDVVKDYLNTHLRNAISNLQDEVKSSERIANESKWLEQFTKMEKDKLSNKSLAFIMSLIANSGNLPPPNELEGIDLASVYTFVSKGLMGLPQKELDKRTMHFLINEYKELCTELKSKKSVAIIKDMHTYFSSSDPPNPLIGELPFDSLVLMNKMFDFVKKLKH